MTDKESTEDSCGRPDEKKPWYRKVSTWVIATVLAALTAFGTDLARRVLDAGAERLTSPISVATERLRDCPYQFVIPGDVNAVAAPPPIEGTAPDSRERWAEQLGGIDAGYTTLRITVSGTSEKPVVLQGLRIEIVERAALLTGFVAAAPCGDALQERYMTVDLDARPPRVVESVDDRNLIENDPNFIEKPVSFPYTVTSSGVEQFLVFVSTRSCNCTWRALLSWSAGERAEVTVIDDAGRPFRTHGDKGYKRYTSYAGEPLKAE